MRPIGKTEELRTCRHGVIFIDSSVCFCCACRYGNRAINASDIGEHIDDCYELMIKKHRRFWRGVKW